MQVVIIIFSQLMIMNFNLDDIDEKDLGKLGLSKEDMARLPLSTRKALETGNRTALMRFKKVQFANGVRNLDAKLSLVKTPEGKTELRLHPVKKYAQNIFNLSAAETELLKTGHVKNVATVQKDEKGNEKQLLVFYDKDTNEYIGVDKNQLNAPDKINGIQLSEIQKDKLQNGETLNLHGLRLSIDPTNELGIKADDVSEEDIAALKALGQTPPTLNTVEFKNGHKYDMDRLAFDVVMCLSGAMPIILVGHIIELLANFVNYSSVNPEWQKLKPAVEKAFPETKEKLDKGEKLTPNELQRIIENHLNRPVIIENLNKDALKKPAAGAKQEVVTEDKKATKEEIKQDFQKVNMQQGVSREEKQEEKEEIKNTTPRQMTKMGF